MQQTIVVIGLGPKVEGTRHCGHLPDSSRVEHVEQTTWLNDSLHLGIGLCCCVSRLVMQTQHSLETITSPARQCWSTEATKLGNEFSGMTLVCTLRFEHRGHCPCSPSDHLISFGSDWAVHMVQTTGSSAVEGIGLRAVCFKVISFSSSTETASSRSLRLRPLRVPWLYMS